LIPEITMSENPYQPPNAHVADKPSTAAPRVRPRQVSTATTLLWISLALGVPSLYLATARDTDTGFLPLLIGMYVFLFAISAFVIVKVYRGRNWARVLLLVMVILSAVVLLFPGEEATPPAALEYVLNVASLVVEIAAVYLLLSHPGKTWFQQAE
jgi:presenilin-like A22 family membrane protease